MEKPTQKKHVCQNSFMASFLSFLEVNCGFFEATVSLTVIFTKNFETFTEHFFTVDVP